MSAHILTRDGKPAFAVLPIEEYEKLLALLEDTRDSAVIDQFVKRLAAGEDDSIPGEVADRMLDGENAVLALRAWRGLTLRQLAQACGVTTAHVSQVEKGKRSMSTQMLKKMAAALGVDAELLL